MSEQKQGSVLTPAEGLDQIIRHGNRFSPLHRRRTKDIDAWRGPNWFRCADGSVLSVIAGWGTYCLPRPDWPETLGGVGEDYAGPFHAVEVWLPGEDDPRAIDVDELRAWIAEHGGLTAGPADVEGALS